MRLKTYLALVFAFLSAYVSAETLRSVDVLARALKFLNDKTNALA